MIKRPMFAAMLAALLIALYGTFSPAQAQGAWRLKETRVYNNMDGSAAAITSERYDSSGGMVEIQLNGNILSFCPGGYEKMRFTWNFPQGASSIVHGGTVSAALDARQVSKSQNCGTQLASRSLMYMYAGSHALQGNSNIDKERFQTGNGLRIFAAEATQNGTSYLRVNTHAYDARMPISYFEVCIGTPTRPGGGLLCYAYVYENAGGGQRITGGFTTENDVDRMGGDYYDFDLPRADPSLCANACANDGKCVAYTYVKPGVQAQNARCWLKSGVTPGVRNACCISGVKAGAMSSLEQDWLLLPDYRPVEIFTDAG